MKIIFESKSDEVTFLNMCIAITKVLDEIKKYSDVGEDEILEKVNEVKDSHVNLSNGFKYLYIDNKKSESDEPPIYLSEKQKENIKKLLFRALNGNQILILYEIENNSFKTITSVLTKLSNKSGISLSTLKLNSKILMQLDLIKAVDFSHVELTKFGKFVNEVMRGDIPR